MKIITATLKELDITAKLFDEYRVYYERDSDIEGARKFLSERMHNRESVIYLALDEYGIGMGFVQLYFSFTSVGMKNLLILNDLYIHPNFRKMGVAEALINKCKELAKNTRSVGLILETRNDNINAQNLYHKTDFIKDTEHTYFFWPNEDVH
jgi:ribosomal protein S18 acetylase RimI-like enzyme